MWNNYFEERTQQRPGAAPAPTPATPPPQHCPACGQRLDACVCAMNVKELQDYVAPRHEAVKTPDQHYSESLRADLHTKPPSRAPSPAKSAPRRAPSPAAPRAFLTKAKPAAGKTTTKTTIRTKQQASSKKKLSQEDSMKEMGGIVAQAFGVGIALPVGVVGLLEASKTLPGAQDADVGLYGFLAVCVGFAAWWGAKTAARDALKAELEAKGLDMSTVDNIAVLKWVAEQDKLGRGKQAVKQIYAAYETESNPWSPFFKPVGAVGKGPKK